MIIDSPDLAEIAAVGPLTFFFWSRSQSRILGCSRQSPLLGQLCRASFLLPGQPSTRISSSRSSLPPAPTRASALPFCVVLGELSPDSHTTCSLTSWKVASRRPSLTTTSKIAPVVTRCPLALFCRVIFTGHRVHCPACPTRR